MNERTIYLLDTTALIDFSKGFEPAKSKILGWIDDGETVAVSCVSVAEFVTGLSVSEREQWKEFLAGLAYWDLTIEAAFQAGVWRNEFKRRGIQLSTTDALIAAAAWQHRATIVTNNARHYPMSGVSLISARE